MAIDDLLRRMRSEQANSEEPDAYGLLREHPAITEEFVQFLWREQCLNQRDLRTLDGRPIHILKPGCLNVHEGPDFRDAEVILDGELVQGAVEIHRQVSDWWTHQHQENSAYASVILHVALWDDSFRLQTPAGEHHIPTLTLAPFLSAPLDELLNYWREERSDACPLVSTMPAPNAVSEVLSQLGRERFLEKVEHFSFRVEHRSIEQVCYEGILDAMGYSANRDPFQELGQRLPLERLLGKPRAVIEALLFGCAGLLPAQTGETPTEDARTYAEKLARIWYSLSDPPTPLQASEWRFARLRPANLPTRRLAGMAAILERCGEDGLLFPFLSVTEQSGHKLSPKQTRDQLCELLMPTATGFWREHSRFSGKRHSPMERLVGKARASDILVNIILPILALWAGIAQSTSLSQSVEQLYEKHPALQSNHITRLMDQWFQLPRRGASAQTQQGMIYLYRLFCSMGLCGICPLAQQLTGETGD